MTLLLFMAGDGRRRGYRHMLDAFWDQAQVARIPLPTENPVSAASFCEARGKVAPEFIRSLLHATSSHFDSTFPSETRWRGQRVLIADGSGQNLQRSEELFRDFGGLEAAYCPQAQISVLVNAVSKAPVDVVVGRYKESEQAILIQHHLPVMAKGDIVILDRGYQGFPVFEALVSAEVDFVARIPTTGTFPAAEEFVRSGEQDRVVRIPSTRRAKTGQTLRLRIVRSKRPDGEDVILVTTLRKASGYSLRDIENLYRMRWEVEEYIKAYKSDYMAQGQLHSRTAHGVRQEILAISLFHALSRLLLAAAAKHVETSCSALSTKAACLGLADHIPHLLLRPGPRAIEWLFRLLVRIARTRDKKRPGRSFPRRSYKPRHRWGPRGRNRA